MNTNIADRPLSLAGHLRNVATVVENCPEAYLWIHSASCNCGLLARSITGLSDQDLMSAYIDQRPNRNGTWKDTGGALIAQCAFNPSVKLPDLFERLKQAGVSPTDYGHIEYLDHRELTSWLSANNRSERKCLIKYFRKWATKIEKYRAKHPDVIHAPSPTESQLEEIELRELVKS